MADPNPKGLTVDMMEREEARILAMRERNEARRDRFLNARVRTIGVDIDALDAQIAEKEAEFEAATAETESRYQRDRFIINLIEQRECEEQEMKRRERLALRDEWAQAKVLPKNQTPKIAGGIDPSACGAAALVNFSGEDESVFDRARLQKGQLKSWSLQQMAEKKAAEGDALEDERRYAAYVKMLSDRQEMLEAEEAAQAKDLRLDQAAENKQMELARQQARLADAAAEAESKKSDVEAQMASALLCEDQRAGLTADGRIRRDMFKGYSKDQLKLFYLENEKLLEDKRAQQARDNDDDAWVRHASSIATLIERAEIEVDADRKATLKEQSEFLKKQAEEAAERRLRDKRDRFGSFGKGFFDGFGTTVR